MRFLLTFAVISITQLAPTASQSELDLKGCKSLYSCWFMPPNCENEDIQNCFGIVKWSNTNGETIRFDMLANVTGMDEYFPNPGFYLSLGFSLDEVMGQDTVIECVYSPLTSKVNAYVSHNEGLHNHRTKQATKVMIKMIASQYQDGRMLCSVEWDNNKLQDLFFPENTALFNLTAREYKLMFALGTADPMNDALIIHQMSDFKYPYTTTEFVNLMVPRGKGVIVADMKDTTISRFWRYRLASLHGIFMLFGWWFFGAVALLFARYFKPMWPKVKWFGEQVWFQLHRDLFIVSVVLQCVGFGFVFLEAGRFFACDNVTECKGSERNVFVHTVLGVICTALALIEPFMAWTRPDGDSKWRLTFNWMHWAAGQTSWVLAAVTMFLGIELGKTGLRRNFGYKPDAIMGSYVAAYILASIALEFISSRERRRVGAGAPSDMKLATINGPMKNAATKKAPNAAGRVIILALFTLYAAAVCVVLSWMTWKCTEHT